MSDTSGPGPRELGPARFQRREAARQERHVLRAIGAGLVLVALVGGLPALLLWLDGAPPIPTGLPTRADLTGAIGPEQLITVLVAVAWLAWLQFTICVVVEARSAVRGIGLPSRVPLSGPSQRFARALVGSVLLAATAVGPATAAAPTVADASATAPVAATVTVQDEQQTTHAKAAGPSAPSTVAAATVSTTSAPDGEPTYLLGDLVLGADEGAELVGHKVYRVQPPQGRYHDNMWDIAERHLGEGRRYKEIFELNKNRVQPDGHQLSLARLIYPNWLLIMPEDATGLDRVTAEVEDSAAATKDADTAGNAASEVGGEASADTPAVDGEATESFQGSFVDWAGASGSLPAAATAGDGVLAEVGEPPHRGNGAGLITAGLLAAGLLAAIEAARRRRRMPEPDDDAVEAEVALRIGADPDRAARLDAALRTLAAGCQDRQLALPAVYAAVVDDSGVELLLAPPAAVAPEPWQVLDEGRRWRLDGQVTPRDGAPAPYPGLVSIGHDTQARDVLVDLEAASGPIAVTGDATAAYEVVTAIAAELATNSWSDGLRVSGAGLPPELSVVEPRRYAPVDDLGPVLAEMTAKRAEQVGADVLTGRVRWPGSDAFVPEYVVLGAGPDERLAGELQAAAAGNQRSPLGVVCAGELPGARWRIEVDAAGNLEVPALGLAVTANRLSRPTAASVAALIEPPAPVGDGGAGVRTLHEAWLPEARPPVTPPVFEADTSRLATAPVRVFVLGPAEVQAGGEIDDDRRDIATEIVVHLALHREGVHPTVLGAAVWPRGVTAEVREAAIERTRAWLGTDPEGSPYLRSGPDGALRLSSDVIVDWEVVQTLLARSRETTSRDEERDLLRRALRVARGPVLSERPRGRYSWLARVRLDRAASDLLVDAAHRLAMLCLDGGDPGTAAAAARAGIRVRPGEQLLWRDLLRIEHSRRGRDGATAVANDLTTELGSLGVAELEAETMALLEELLPPPADGHPPAQEPAQSAQLPTGGHGEPLGRWG